MYWREIGRSTRLAVWPLEVADSYVGAVERVDLGVQQVWNGDGDRDHPDGGNNRQHDFTSNARLQRVNYRHVPTDTRTVRTYVVIGTITITIIYIIDLFYYLLQAYEFFLPGMGPRLAF